MSYRLLPEYLLGTTRALAVAFAATADLAVADDVNRNAVAAFAATADSSADASVDRNAEASIAAVLAEVQALSVDLEVAAELDAAVDVGSAVSVEREVAAASTASVDGSAVASWDLALAGAIAAASAAASDLSVDRDLAATLDAQVDLSGSEASDVNFWVDGDLAAEGGAGALSLDEALRAAVTASGGPDAIFTVEEPRRMHHPRTKERVRQTASQAVPGLTPFGFDYVLSEELVGRN